MCNARRVSQCAGYEGWFLSEATSRSPGMTSSSLQWAAPLFVGEADIDGGDSLFTQTNIDGYVVTWLRCMRDAYGVNLTYQGAGWNEKARWGVPSPVEGLCSSPIHCRADCSRTTTHTSSSCVRASTRRASRR